MAKPNVNMKLVLRIALVVGLVAYLGVTVAFSSMLADTRVCRGIGIHVLDTFSTGFVKAAELQRELGDIYTEAAGKPLRTIDLRAIEQRLGSIDKIESVNAAVMSNDSIYVTVHPLQPVARVFDSNGSYYVNAVGKRFRADARYSMDVPVVHGNFGDGGVDIAKVLPLINYIESTDELREFISMVEVKSLNDIYLIPDIRGQVLEFGTPDLVADKFSRLKLFYSEVMPHKGWNYYDTISVKWNGQVVATRARKQKRRNDLPTDTVADIVDGGDEGIELGADSVVLVNKSLP